MVDQVNICHSAPDSMDRLASGVQPEWTRQLTTFVFTENIKSWGTREICSPVSETLHCRMYYTPLLRVAGTSASRGMWNLSVWDQRLFQLRSQFVPRRQSQLHCFSHSWPSDFPLPKTNPGIAMVPESRVCFGRETGCRVGESEFREKHWVRKLMDCLLNN